MQQAHTPTRSLPLAGATNFRDLGGYVGHGGQAVKWRRIFRSDHLAGLTPEDQALLADLAERSSGALTAPSTRLVVLAP